MKCKETFWGTRHNFGKWSIIQDGELTHNGIATGTYFIQERICEDCGFTERKMDKKEA